MLFPYIYVLKIDVLHLAFYIFKTDILFGDESNKYLFTMLNVIILETLSIMAKPRVNLNVSQIVIFIDKLLNILLENV